MTVAKYADITLCVVMYNTLTKDSIVDINNKPVLLRNKEAARLVRLRAIKEGRSASNAAAQTVIEALRDTYDISNKDTQESKVCKIKSN